LLYSPRNNNLYEENKLKR